MLQAAADLLLDAQAQVARLQPPMIEGASYVATAISEPVKAGYKTSEFWLTAIHTIAGLIAASGSIPGFADPTVRATTLGSAAISLALYIFSRIRAKS